MAEQLYYDLKLGNKVIDERAIIRVIHNWVDQVDVGELDRVVQAVLVQFNIEDATDMDLRFIRERVKDVANGRLNVNGTNRRSIR